MSIVNLRSAEAPAAVGIGLTPLPKPESSISTHFESRDHPDKRDSEKIQTGCDPTDVSGGEI